MIVQSLWVVACYRKKRLVSIKGFEPDLKRILSGTCIRSWSVAASDEEKISFLAQILGADVNGKDDTKLTHIITSETSAEKLFNKSIELEKIGEISLVTSKWLTECCQKKKKVPVDGFHPILVENSKEIKTEEKQQISKKRKFDDTELDNETEELDSEIKIKSLSGKVRKTGESRFNEEQVERFYGRNEDQQQRLLKFFLISKINLSRNFS